MAGTLIILITTLFMNAGSHMSITDEQKNEFMANQIVMNTIISSASSGLYIVAMQQLSQVFGNDQHIKDTQLLYQYNVHTLCNGVLAGLVSVTASCARIELWSAALIGMVGGIIFLSSKRMI